VKVARNCGSAAPRKPQPKSAQVEAAYRTRCAPPACKGSIRAACASRSLVPRPHCMRPRCWDSCTRAWRPRVPHYNASQAQRLLTELEKIIGRAKSTVSVQRRFTRRWRLPLTRVAALLQRRRGSLKTSRFESAGSGSSPSSSVLVPVRREDADVRVCPGSARAVPRPPGGGRTHPPRWPRVCPASPVRLVRPGSLGCARTQLG
jgi:hypothetical protein